MRKRRKIKGNLSSWSQKENSKIQCFITLKLYPHLSSERVDLLFGGVVQILSLHVVYATAWQWHRSRHWRMSDIPNNISYEQFR